MVGVATAVTGCTGHTIPLVMVLVRVVARAVPSHCALRVGGVLLLGVHRGATHLSAGQAQAVRARGWEGQTQAVYTLLGGLPPNSPAGR